MYRHDSREMKRVGLNQHALGHHAWSASLPVKGKGRQHLPGGHWCWEPSAYQAALTVAAGSAPSSSGHLYPQAALSNTVILPSFNTVQLTLPLDFHPTWPLTEHSPILPDPARRTGRLAGLGALPSIGPSPACPPLFMWADTLWARSFSDTVHGSSFLSDSSLPAPLASQKAGHSPADHTSLSWTFFPAARFPQKQVTASMALIIALVWTSLRALRFQEGFSAAF